MTYYILEFEKPKTVTFWKTNYETSRYVYANKKIALKMLRQAKSLKDLKNPRLITATPNEEIKL